MRTFQKKNSVFIKDLEPKISYKTLESNTEPYLISTYHTVLYLNVKKRYKNAEVPTILNEKQAINKKLKYKKANVF